MEIPTKCTVLVIGGGPAGSYAATILAREGIDTVCLEADVFPRYHIGESMLPSIRHFFRLIDLDGKFDAYGFQPKKGAMFKLNSQTPVYTDFVAAGGPNGYAWNVTRAEADEIMFRHAADNGAKVFDGVKVSEISFSQDDADTSLASLDPSVPELGRPVSVTWSRKIDGVFGKINFDYLVDASGRAGLMATKYMKNRKYNQGLKNVASWGYWKGMKTYGIGTPAEGQPYFEALDDASGWVWTIPLHSGITSVGVVMNQEIATQKKKAIGSGRDFYLASIRQVPGIEALLADATLESESIKSASDWSYSASSYATPYTRLAGDAGCFIDPFFSSGVHLALASGLSAAVTICAAKRGDCSESVAAKWHSSKVAEGYTRFLLVVLSALRQTRQQDEPVLADFDEHGFDRAFALFRPIIQGTADTSTKLTQGEISKTVDFCLRAFQPVMPSERAAVMTRIEDLKKSNGDEVSSEASMRALEATLSADEQRILSTIRARQILRSEDTMNLDHFGTDVIEGMAPKLERGKVGLRKAEPASQNMHSGPDVLALMTHEEEVEWN